MKCADVVKFTTIEERSESIVGRAADYKSAAIKLFADVAQLAEQLICNQQVIGSSPIIGFFHFNPQGMRTFSSVG